MFTTVVLSTLLIASLAPPARSAHAATSAPNLRTVRIKSASVLLRYPRSWTVFARQKQGIAAQLRALSKRDPRLAEAFRIEVQTAALPTTQFDASNLRSGFANKVSSAVTVQVVEGGFPSSLDNFTSAREPSVQQAGGTVLNASTIKISGDTAYRLDVSLPVPKPDGTVVSTLLGQLLVRRGSGRVVITVGVPNDQAGAMLIDQILRNVRRI